MRPGTVSRTALGTAAGILQQRLALLRQMSVGLLYPGILMVVAVLSIGLIMIAVIPQFRPLVDDRMEMIPVLGRMIFAISAGLSALWPYLAAGLLAARLPWIGGVILRNQVMIALHAIGALLQRGVTLSEALNVTARASSSPQMRAALNGVARTVADGAALSVGLARSGMVATSAIEMVRIGEETGDLSGMVTRAADEMREAADRDLERFLALFQPALIILVGLIVGVSLYALFSAIVSVNAIAF